MTKIGPENGGSDGLTDAETDDDGDRLAEGLRLLLVLRLIDGETDALGD